MPTPSVQLYSVRESISDNLDHAIRRLAEIGFTLVEPYAFHLRTDDYKRAFSANGISAPTGHAPVIDSADPNHIFDAALELGIVTVIDPFIPTERWQTSDDIRALAERVNDLADQATDRGLHFGYHNHQWEFTNQVDGRPAYDLFVELLAPEVILEVDTFWATVGGVDTPELLRSLGARTQALHIKDGKVTGDIASALPSSESALIVPEALVAAFENQTPAGQGDIDISSILAAAPHALRVIEFDAYSGDVFEGIRQSLAWLRANDSEVNA
jgi:sugar phosphate isomerase/epimerase